MKRSKGLWCLGIVVLMVFGLPTNAELISVPSVNSCYAGYNNVEDTGAYYYTGPYGTASEYVIIQHWNSTAFDYWGFLRFQLPDNVMAQDVTCVSLDFTFAAALSGDVNMLYSQTQGSYDSYPAGGTGAAPFPAYRPWDTGRNPADVPYTAFGIVGVGGSAAGNRSVDVTTVVKEALTRGDDFAVFGFYFTTTYDSVNDYVYSQNAANPSNRPFLNITVPEPATMVLLSLGGLMLRRRS